MRSQLVLASILALAISGCGKSVTREAGTAAQLVVPENSLRGSVGPCVDPIGEPPYKQVQNFSDLAENSGNYELTSLEASSRTTVSGFTGNVEGISVISGTEVDGKFQLTQVCSDYSQVPVGDHSWKISTPAGVAGKDGSIKAELTLQQSIHAQSVSPALSAAQTTVETKVGCSDLNEVIDGKKCGVAKVYQIDGSTIGVLRIVRSQNSTSGPIVSKIFAHYTLKKVAKPVEPTSPKPTENKPKNKPKVKIKKTPVQRGTSGQGGTVGQGKTN